MRRTSVMIMAALIMATLSTASAQGSAKLAEYDGETLFKGMFLAVGPAADIHPGPRTDSPLADTQATQLVNAMKHISQDFFPTFEDDITSGDRVRIGSALESARDLMVEASPAVGTTGPQGTFIVVNKVVVKASNTVVNKNNYWSSADSDSRLAREFLINDLAESLAR